MQKPPKEQGRRLVQEVETSNSILPHPPSLTQYLELQWAPLSFQFERRSHYAWNLEINRFSLHPAQMVAEAVFEFSAPKIELGLPPPMNKLPPVPPWKRRRNRPNSVPCAYENCWNEAIHISTDGIGFCLSHFEFNGGNS